MCRTVVLAVVAGALMPASACFATTRNVPVDHSTIQAAITASSAGDVVVVAPGTYTEKIDFMNKSITVRSSAGAATTTISGAGGTGSTVKFDSGEGTAAVLDGFTITGGTGTSSRGGGIYIWNSDPTIRNCFITGNTAQQGAGMYVELGTPAVMNCVFAGNTATSNGGAITCEFATPTFMLCTITGNTAPSGAALYSKDNQPFIINCIVWGAGTNAFKGPAGDTGQPRVSYSSIQAGATYVDQGNNIASDPLFADSGAGDFTLLPGSPCIDRGNSMALTGGIYQVLMVNSPQDLGGDARGADDPSSANLGQAAFQVAVDMGAYEFQPEPCSGGGNDCPEDLAPPGGGDGTITISDVLEVLTAFGTNCP